MVSGIRLHIIPIILLLVTGLKVHAGNNPEYRATLFGKNGNLLVHNTVYVSDLNYQTYKTVSGAIERTYYVKNAVRLMLDEESTWYAQSDFSISAELKVIRENAAGAIDSVSKTLTLDYKKGQGLTSGAITSYEFKDAVNVTVRIVSLTKNVSWDVTKNLKLVNEIISLRDWGFTCTATIPNITTDSLFSDEWKVKWGVPENFQTEYDLEWAWVEESAIDDYKVSGTVDMNLVFDNNATRVSTSNNYYRIPLLYEDNGRLYARVRMAQSKVNGQRVEGNWFYLSDGGQAYLARTTSHQENLNWQATTTFAEEGKRKTVIQYFDGSLRGRQTVTKDNVNKTTVVAESFYDYQGRPVIQVLPSPTLNTIIQFTKNFNQFDDARNAKTVYDKLDGSESACNKLTAKMLNTATGSAAQYYSGQNPLKNSGYNQFIPDAEGYPYTETRYTNDGTGRVDAQGGVGKVFQVNSGHENKYFYESADQDDLDALFGTDAGYASHYSKNWVRDANGQYSISFVDMKGKTVATALAGTPPQALAALPSYAAATKTITRQLIDQETNNVHGNSIISSKSLMVAKAGNFQFNYYLSPEKLKMMLCTNTEFCFDCLYELNIRIVPDCSDKVVAGFPNPLIKKNFNLGEYLTSCAGTQSPLLDTTFTVWLEEGAYTVVKELKLSTAARDWYRENVYITNDTCKTRASFLSQQLSLALSQQNCYTTCAQCTTKLGTQAEFITRFRTESGLSTGQVDSLMPQIIAAYNEFKANCDRLCDVDSAGTLDELADIRSMMLQDMTPPFGQYATYPAGETHPYNIFNPNPPALSVLCPPVTNLRHPYRYPVDYDPSTGGVTCSTTGYKNGYGVVNFPTSKLLSPSTTPDTLIDAFEDSYAYSLLPYHPEFCKLKNAELHLKGTYRFAGRMQNTEAFNQAVMRGYINPSLTTAGSAADYLMQKDSFFIKVGFSSQYYTEMYNAITSNYIAANTTCGSPNISMWKLAQLSVFCHKEMRANAGQTPGPGNCLTPSAAYQSCFSSLTNLPPSALSHCDADMNMVWKNFKAMYLSLRNVLISRYLNNTCNGSINYSIFNTSNGYNYKERFTRYTTSAPYLINNLGDLGNIINNANPAAYQQQMALEADSICRANTGNWMFRLRRCPDIENFALTYPLTWAADSTWLSKYLIKICTPGVDYLGHPFGAASLPDAAPAVEITENPSGTGVSVFIRSFPELVRYYLNFRSFSINAFCYPELIDFPKAYNVAPAIVTVPVISTPEPCACDRINYFKTKWENAGSPGTFSHYLANTQGTIINQDTLNLLVNMCRTGYADSATQCNFLTGPITLPAIFQCRGSANLDSSKTCINCADYKAIKQAFLAERGVAAPVENPQTEAEVALNRAFQDFANYRTGFNKLWPEYVAFGQLCPNDSGFTCTELYTLLNAYNATSHPDTGLACRNAFVTFMNNATGRSYTFDQWMDEFIKSCGAQPPVCQPVLTCASFRLIIFGYYKTYGVQAWRNINCQENFTSYVNTQLGTSYTYADIVSRYRKLCGTSCPIEVCSFPNPLLLTYLYDIYKLNYANTDVGTGAACQTHFANWFNNILGFNATPYSWDQITAMYNMYSIDCTPDLNQLCLPPHTCDDLNAVLAKFYITYPVPDTLSNCEAVFTAFFNTRLGTSYTYSEILWLYQTICHITLNVCESSTGSWDCKELKLLTRNFNCPDVIGVDRCECFKNHFNARFGTSYTYQEIVDIYLKYCNFILNICSETPPVFTCEQLQRTLKLFNTNYPRSAEKLGPDCQAIFTAFFNGQHGTNLDYAQISDQYLVVCSYVLDVCDSKCTEYAQFVSSYNTRYGSIKIPQAARKLLFTYMFNTTFGFNNTVANYTTASRNTTDNSPLVYEQVKKILDTCLISVSGLQADTIAYSLSDADVLKAYRTAYYLMHPSGMPANCSEEYTAWINSTLSTLSTLGSVLEYKEIQEFYETAFGAEARNICEIPTTVAGNAAELPVRDLNGRASLPQYPPLLCGLNIAVSDPPPVDTTTCKNPLLLSISDANIKYELYLDSLRRNFDLAWYKKCIRAKELESFTVTYSKAEHHYTLYYYDQAGQLVRTVPPEGVDDKRSDATFLANVKTKRANVAAGQAESSNILIPTHRLATDYRYNTLGKTVEQKTPDAGKNKFWYDILGRLAVSQNAQQAIDNKYSYTAYDILGRITEVGQKPHTTAMTQTISRSVSSLSSWLNTTANKEQITRTVYDVSYFDGDDLLKPELLYQRNLRNRVSYTQVFDAQPTSYAGTHRAATYYSYDIHGSVDTLLQDYGNSAYYSNVMNSNGNRYKKMAYDYDLISGKVNMVTYQPGYYKASTQTWITYTDRFYHRYVYDAENKLTDVYTSHDSLIWERDASYIYYRHGPLARTVLGQQQVQGVDYAYTLQGWLKGVNSTAISEYGDEICSTGTAKDILDVYTRRQFGAPSIYTARQEINFQTGFDHEPGDDFETIINAGLAPCNPVIISTQYANGDMGQDGKSASPNQYVSRDAYGFSLNYYQVTGGTTINDYKAINGTNQPFASAGMFKADNIDGQKVATPLFNGNIASMFVNIPKLGEAQLYGYKYDQLNRIVSMDAFNGFSNADNGWTGGVPTALENYKERIAYDANGNILGYLRNGSTANGGLQQMDSLTYGYNRSSGNLLNNRLRHVKDAIGDANYQEDIDSQPDDNYDYDAIGNLIKDTKEGITKISWNVYGKISYVVKSGDTIKYTYDVSGNRISKTFNGKTTWYVRDAKGSVMAVYEQRSDLNSNHLTQSEVHLYGNSRLGVYNINRDMGVPVTGDITVFERGNKAFELSNHLQNVLVTISDRKMGVSGNGTTIDYYVADVVTANDMYSYGMAQPGRNFKQAGKDYRYSINGQEKEKEIHENITSAEFWMYDSRIGRRWNIDPMVKAWESPYAVFANNPISFIDPNGADTVKDRNKANIGDVYKTKSGIYVHKSEAGWFDDKGTAYSFTSTKKIAGPLYNNYNSKPVLDGNHYPSPSYFKKQSDLISGGPLTSTGLTTKDVERVSKILNSSEYLELSLELGKKIPGVEDGLRNVTLIFKTSSGEIKILSTLQGYNALTKTLGWTGNLATGLEVGLNINEYVKGEISGQRLAYRLTGNALSFASPIIYGAIVGSNAGPVGLAIGVVVGITFTAGEAAYDYYQEKLKPQIQEGIRVYSNPNNWPGVRWH